MPKKSTTQRSFKKNPKSVKGKRVVKKTTPKPKRSVAKVKKVEKKKVVKKPIKKPVPKKKVFLPRPNPAKKTGRAYDERKVVVSPVDEGLPPIPPTDDVMWRLFTKGRRRGFLTEFEVFSVFPRLECYISEFEGFLDILDFNGITMFEHKGGLL